MPEPIICPITQEPILPGEEFTLLSGHVFNARALAAWVTYPEFREAIPRINPLQNALVKDITSAWVYGKNMDAFHLGRLFYDDRLKELQHSIHSIWGNKPQQIPSHEQY